MSHVILPKELKYTLDQLNRVSFMPLPTGVSQRWAFSEVCDSTLTAIRVAFSRNPSQNIILNRVEGNHILDFVDFGLSEGKSYTTASEAERKQSWIYEILAKLRENCAITNFEIKPLSPNRVEIHIQKN